MLDLAAPAAAFGYGIGRIGCFLSGDGCYGLPTNLPWGMAFPHGIDPVYVPVHPTPLYEMAAGILIGCFLYWRGGKAHATGAILGQYLLLTGIARFLVEFIRRNPKVLWGLSNAQLASAGAAVVGIALIVWTATRPPNCPRRYRNSLASPHRACGTPPPPNFSVPVSQVSSCVWRRLLLPTL